MSRPVYRWRVTPPPYYGIDSAEVLGASRYDAIIAAAKLWRTPWTPLARICTFEKIEEWTAPSNCNVCEFINLTEEKQHKAAKGSPHMCLRHQKRVYHNSSRRGYHDTILPCKECVEEQRRKSKNERQA